MKKGVRKTESRVELCSLAFEIVVEDGWGSDMIKNDEVVVNACVVVGIDATVEESLFKVVVVVFAVAFVVGVVDKSVVINNWYSRPGINVSFW